MLPLQEPKILKYWVLVEHLREQVANGHLQAGSRAPSLAEMQAKFGVSRATVEKAYSLLEQDGLLKREQGRGTFVARPETHNATRVLGLMLRVEPHIGLYTVDLLAGMREEAVRHNLDMLWLNEQETPDLTKVDALLMYCHPTEALAFNLPPQSPHALLFHHSPDFTCVAADDFSGAKLATQHLLELGHRRIAYLLASDSDSISRRRLAGYYAALEAAGLSRDENLVRFLHEPLRFGYRKASELMMQSWMEEGWRNLDCTAILAHNDDAAIGVIRLLRQHGLSVPDDVSVIGFDGTELSELSNPVLTTIKVPLREIGAAAIKTLLAQLENGILPEPQKIELPVQLHLGESTARVRAGSEAFVPLLNKRND